MNQSLRLKGMYCASWPYCLGYRHSMAANVCPDLDNDITGPQQTIEEPDFRISPLAIGDQARTDIRIVWVDEKPPVSSINHLIEMILHADCCRHQEKDRYGTQRPYWCLESAAVFEIDACPRMTVTAIMAGLLPILWGTGTGAEVMSRIAAPMVGGMISSTVLTLAVIPAIYGLVKGWRLERM